MKSVRLSSIMVNTRLRSGAKSFHFQQNY
uniref:Uncharacterized protein n=1 Tax=Arundo donax TaxID=35708 RepID=A0A0A9A0T6_ARUDO